jgi:hypothetical protein
MKWARTDLEIAACYEVMKELRPHFSEQEFLSQVKLQQESGYQLVYETSENTIVTVAGFRISYNLAWGNSCISMIWLPWKNSDRRDLEPGCCQPLLNMPNSRNVMNYTLIRVSSEPVHTGSIKTSEWI